MDLPSNGNGNGNGHAPKTHGKSLPAHLIPGNPGNSGGKPGRSGRKPAAWKEACERALEEADALPVLKKIIAGEYVEQVGTTRDGKPIYESTKASDRIGAVKFLASYAHGEPKNALLAAAQLETPDGFKFSLILGEREQPDD